MVQHAAMEENLKNAVESLTVSTASAPEASCKEGVGQLPPPPGGQVSRSRSWTSATTDTDSWMQSFWEKERGRFSRLILQVTIGCSWNRCSFCEMYQEKTFRARPLDEIVSELDKVVAAGGGLHVRDVFLADGDAMTLPTGALEQILDAIRERFPRVRRISSYCLPRNVRGKSVEALSKLRGKGLSLVYVGCESGSDTVLSAVEKGETFESSLDALSKLRDAGIKRSVMILIGLGGKAYSEEHASRSAALCSASEPEFLSLLTTSFPRGKGRVEEGYANVQDGTEDEYNRLKN